MTGRNIALILFILIFGVLLYFLFLYRPVMWYDSLRQTAKQPYDLHFIKHLIQNSPETAKFRELKGPVDRFLPVEADEPSLYIAMGPGLRYQEEQMSALIDFVYEGNHAILSLKYFPQTLLNELIWINDTIENQKYQKSFVSSQVQLKYKNSNQQEDSARIYFANGKDYTVVDWYYFDPIVLLDTTIAEIGRIDTFINMIEIPIGSGKFVLHATPLAFSNLHLSNPEVLHYANYVFGQSTHRNVYWEVYNIISIEDAYNQDYYRDESLSRSRVMVPGEGPLFFILSFPAFRNAWYVLLGGALLYLMFMGKRKQRPVPVLKPLENTSLDYIKTIGEVYFRHTDAKEMGLHLLQGFFRDFYKTYRMPWEPVKPGFVDLLTQKSGLDFDTVSKAVRYISTVNNTRFFGDEQLAGLKQHMDKILNLR
jgi:hypothetical protein